ncbi:hypothetical protein NI467_06235 [Acinetobacter bohemicus]|uniref:hypothetical protein n=1 Tax=Acinetobacter sp. S4397-1 TaxID=2972915 RepID=UPI00209A80E9|nr:hypothetical protein [Acinetobacter sp. S4397-1]MCO8044955.1 hypothetical protein [Acinetobacter sp. S4397-1]
MRNSIIDLERAKLLIAAKKIFTDDVIMQTTGSQHQYSRFSSPVYDERGDNIPGLSLRLETNRTQGYMKHTLGLLLREGSATNPIIDLCIYPNTTRSHVDRATRTKIYGSHLHILNNVSQLDLDYNSTTWPDYFAMFAHEANIEFSSSRIIGPFEGELL